MPLASSHVAGASSFQRPGKRERLALTARRFAPLWPRIPWGPADGLAFDRLGLPISAREVAHAFEPFATARRVGPSDPQWRELVAKTERGAARKLARQQAAPTQRKTTAVQSIYDHKWATTELEARLSPHGQLKPMLWRGRRILARGIAPKRVHLLLLSRAISRLRPATVLEVGFGTGTNLFALGARFPDVHFSGVELTRAGVDFAKSLQRERSVPEPIARFFPEPLRDRTAHVRVELQQGTAVSLPFGSNSFDLVYTVLALEQMEDIRELALRELARVASGHVAMVEPFRDWNEEGIRRDKALARNYFSARVGELPSLGLEPLVAFSDFPHKINERPGFVLARANGKHA